MNTNYRFGQFHLDTSSRNLFSEGKVTRLSPRAFGILVLLIKHRGDVVRKEEILNSIWSDSYVEENNLAVHVSALRNVLAERESGIKYIETVSGLGYRFLAPVLETHRDSKSTNSAELQTTPSELRSVAVLPIVNKNADPKLNYLADGITDHLIADLSQLSKLKVISYAAVSKYKDNQPDVQEIGFLLAVDSILAGTIVEIDEVLEVRVELIRVNDLSQIWTTEYRCKLEQLYRTKTDISVALAEKLHIQLSRSETRQISKDPVRNTEAYRYYLRGRQVADLRSKTDLEESIVLFEKALSLDPRFADAMACIGFSYTYLALSFYMPPPEAVSKAEKAIQSALDIDYDLAEAHAVRGFLQLYQMNIKGAKESLEKAIRLNSNSAFAHTAFAIYLLVTGDFKDCLEHQYTAMSLNPLGISSIALSGRLMIMGEFQKAIENGLEVAEMLPNVGSLNFVLAYSYAHLGEFDLAFQNIRMAIEKSPSTEIWALEGYINAIAGNRTKAESVVDDLIKNYSDSPVDFVDIAAIYNALGNKDETFNYLEKAFDFGISHLFIVNVDPRFRSLRGDPRYGLFLQKIGFDW